MTRHRSNVPRFVDETVDGEALIMDMVKGIYFSCVGASASAFNALKDGMTTEEVAHALSAANARPVDAMQTEVEEFAAELRRYEILVVDSVNGDSRPASSIDVQGSYEPLQIDRFDDLADLILLDPVHDVSEAGWPTEAT